MANITTRPVEAGSLRHPLIFQSRSEGKDAAGGKIITYTDTFTDMGSIEPLRGTEYWEAKKANVEVTGKIKIRWRAGVSPTMRIKTADGRYFKIIAIMSPGEKRRLLEIIYTEGE